MMTDDNKSSQPEITTVDDGVRATTQEENTSAINVFDEEDAEQGAQTPEPLESQQTEETAENALDDDKEAEGGEAQEPEGQVKENALTDGVPSPEEVKAFCAKLPALNMGDGMQLDDELVTSIAPELMALSKGNAKKANAVVASYVKFAQARKKAIDEQIETESRALLDESRRQFGADFKSIVKYARIGGEALFADSPGTWNELRKEKRVANNPAMLRALAKYGRSLAQDSGRISEPTTRTDDERGDVLHRMYGGLQV